MKIALVVGGTGLIGKACLYELLEQKEYIRIIAVVRKPMPLKHHQLEQIVVDFDNLEQYSDQLKADDIFCCLGTTIKVSGSQENFRKVDFDYPVKIAQIALQNGAQQFLIVSAMGANSQSSIFYNRVKGDVEAAVSYLGYRSLHIFRPSLLMGDRKQVRIGELIGKGVMTIIGFLFIGPLKKYKAIHGATVAKAMVKVALKEEKGRLVYESDRIAEIGGSIPVAPKIR
jgi:uncharacterized protein YbjT (DUF2867 family)